MAGRSGRPTTAHADGGDRVNDPIVARLGVVGTPSCGKSALTDNVESQTFVDGVCDSRQPLAATIVFLG